MAGIEFHARLGSAAKLSFRVAIKIDPMSGSANDPFNVARGLLVRQRSYSQSLKNGDGLYGIKGVNELVLAANSRTRDTPRTGEEIFTSWTGRVKDCL